jgi:hypothetical protein
MTDAMAIVDEERRRGRRGDIEVDKATHQGTLRFLHLYVASHLMALGMFSKAGDYFAKGKVDPRILVRSFPSLRGKLIGSAEEVEVYEGLKDVLSGMPDLEGIGEYHRNCSQKDSSWQFLVDCSMRKTSRMLDESSSLRRPMQCWLSFCARHVHYAGKEEAVEV